MSLVFTKFHLILFYGYKGVVVTKTGPTYRKKDGLIEERNDRLTDVSKTLLLTYFFYFLWRIHILPCSIDVYYITIPTIPN